VYIPAEFDQDRVTTLNMDNLPDDWSKDPPPPIIQQIGDSWVENQGSVILEVPSAIVPREKNYLINPVHPDFITLKIGSPTKLEFDPRLVKS
jgi:RES domain-containing protein